MRSPSAKVLYNRVDVYSAASGRDTDGGVTEPYPSIPTFPGVFCTVQPVSASEIEDQQRITKITEYKIMFSSYLAINPRDKIVWQDPQGTIHLIYAKANRDEAGRNAAYTVFGEERV
jgi:hypothetical protein